MGLTELPRIDTTGLGQVYRPAVLLALYSQIIGEYPTAYHFGSGADSIFRLFNIHGPYDFSPRLPLPVSLASGPPVAGSSDSPLSD